jgi:hypothetical protein
LIAAIGFLGLGRSDISGASRSGETQRRDAERDSDLRPIFELNTVAPPAE